MWNGTPWLLRSEMIEDRTCIKIDIWCDYVGHDFMWLVKLRDWCSGVRVIEPEYERFIQIILNDYVYYLCKLRGLSAFSGEQDSLLRCVGGVGEAGALYVNKWFNCNQELFLLFSSPEVHYRWITLWLWDFRHCRTGERPSPIGHVNATLGVTPSQFHWHWSATLGPVGGICRTAWNRSWSPSWRPGDRSQTGSHATRLEDLKGVGVLI